MTSPNRTPGNGTCKTCGASGPPMNHVPSIFDPNGTGDPGHKMPNRTPEDELKSDVQHGKGYEAGYDTRTLEADHELEDALKAQATALLEKGPKDLEVPPDSYTAKGHDEIKRLYARIATNQANAQWRSIIKEQGGLR